MVFLFLVGFAGLQGVVEDPQGKPVDGAEVVLYQKGGVERTRTRAGAFSFPAADGRSLVEVTAAGFRRASREMVDGEVIRLEIGGVDQRVVVTAEGVAQTIDQVSKAMSVVDAAEIGRRNEYSLAEALRNTPGLAVRNLGGPGQLTSIRMRGLRADATAVLIDGLRFRDVATIQGDASGFVGNMNVINLERVEVLRGSGSSLYGSNAVGGTVNLVTDQGGGPAHGGMLMEGGGLGLIRAKGTVSGGWKKLAYSAGLLHMNVLNGVDGDDRARSSGVQTFGKYALGRTASVSGRLYFSDDFVQSNISPTTTGIPAANLPNTTVITAVPMVTYFPSRNDPDSRRASRFWSGAAIYRQQLTSTIDLQGSYQRVRTSRTFRNGPAGIGFQPLVSNLSEFEGTIDTGEGRANWRPLTWWAFTGGYEFEREGYLNRDDNKLPPPGTVAVSTKAGQRSQALYFANQLTMLGRRLQVSVSGRMQDFSLDVPRFVTTGTANNYGRVAVVSPPRAWTGDVALSYFVAKTGTKLRAHGGNSYRAPGLYERYGSGFFFSAVTNSVGFSPYGDPRLAPDRYNSVDGGVDQYLFRDKLRLSGTVFYTRIVQITQFDSSAGIVRPGADLFGRTSGYYNGAGGISRGMESTAELKPVRGTMLRTSYWYVNANTDQDLAVRGFWGALSVPKHSWSSMVNQQLGKRTEVTVDLFRSSAYHNALFAGGRSRAFLYPGLVKLDIVLSRDLVRAETYTLRLYGKGDQILNRAYYENGFQGAGATGLVGLQILFR